MIDRVLKVSRLFDFYGALLTERQQQCIDLHYFSDLSLAEIADEWGVTRQAVHDILRRSEQFLEDCEHKLALIERFQQERQEMRGINEMLAALPAEYKQVPQLQAIQQRLAALLGDTKEA